MPKEYKTSKRYLKLELEANVFATHLLIPTELLKKELDEGFDLTDDKGFQNLCKKFDVAGSTMAFKFYLMGISKIPLGVIKTQINQR